MATHLSRLTDLITAIGTDWKAIWANTGNKVNLSTTNKNDLVSAINEVNAKPSSTGGAAIDDLSTTSTTSTYSVSKIVGLDSANMKLTTAQTVAGVKTFSSAPVVPDGSFTIAKTTGLQAALDTKPGINDSALSTSTLASGGVWSPSKITTEITNAKNAILGAGVPAALDTLDELAAALGDDANFAGTVTTGLSNRLRVDVSTQGLTLTQQQNGRTNLNAFGSVELGNPDADLVALYTAAKA